MPELPEVETIRRGLAPVLEGRVLARVEQRRPDLRIPFPPRFAERLTGRRVVALGRRAKYLLFHLDDGAVLIGHLGMSGRMVVSHGEPPVLGRHDHAVFLTDAGATVVFQDPRRFGLMDLTDEATLPAHPLFAKLGPEPLGDAFDGPALAARLAARSGPVKVVLLDQTVVAGLGNIYVSESLHAAGIHPARPANAVTGAEARKLAAAIKDVLERAIAAGGSTLRDYVGADGELGYFQHSFTVYGREGEPCPRCAAAKRGETGIVRIVQGGRATYFCPRHQR
jgi:formamidopyrimidine-DNA glycosylase